MGSNNFYTRRKDTEAEIQNRVETLREIIPFNLVPTTLKTTTTMIMGQTAIATQEVYKIECIMTKAAELES